MPDINAGLQPTEEQIIAERLRHNAQPTINPSAITPSSLETANPINVNTPPPADTPSPADAAKEATQKDIEARIQMERDIEKNTQTEKQKQAGTLQEQISSAKTGLLGESAFTTQTRAEKVGTLESDLTSIKNQMEAFGASHQNYLKNIEGKPVTMASIYGQQARENADYNAQILTLSAQSNILMNNIALAEKQITQAVEAKFGPQKELLAVKQSQLDALVASGELTKAEKQQADALSAYYKKEEQKIADEKAVEKQNTDFVIDLAKKYRDAGIQLTDTIEQAQSKAEKSQSYLQEQTGGTLDLQYKQAQIANIQSEIANRGLSGAEYDPMSILAYAQQYSATGQIPAGIPKGSFGVIAQIAKEIPKVEGTLVDRTTGTASKTLSSGQQDGIQALYDITKKIQDLKKKEFQV